MSSVVKLTRLKARWDKKTKKVRKVTQIGRDKIYCMSCWPSIKEQKETDPNEDILWVEVEVGDHELYRCDNCGDLVA